MNNEPMVPAHDSQSADANDLGIIRSLAKNSPTVRGAPKTLKLVRVDMYATEPNTRAKLIDHSDDESESTGNPENERDDSNEDDED